MSPDSESASQKDMEIKFSNCEEIHVIVVNGTVIHFSTLYCALKGKECEIRGFMSRGVVG